MPDTLFDNTIDSGKWRLLVEGTDQYKGILKVIEVDTDTIVHQEEVGLMFGAIFGPDVADVYAWQEIALDIVDNPLRRRPPQ